MRKAKEMGIVVFHPAGFLRLNTDKKVARNPLADGYVGNRGACFAGWFLYDVYADPANISGACFGGICNLGGGSEYARQQTWVSFKTIFVLGVEQI